MRLPRPSRRTLGRALLVLALGALFALSLPGVRAARADDKDLAPSADELFGLGAAPAAPAPAPAHRVDSCEAARRERQQGQAAYGQLVAQLRKQPVPGNVRVLNGRGYNYPSMASPGLSLERLRREAERDRQAR